MRVSSPALEGRVSGLVTLYTILVVEADLR